MSSASCFGVLRTQIGASAQFSSTVRCGNRLKCWNTMPTSRRTSSIFLRSLVSSTPSTTILPFWCSSSRLMQRIMVDLPEPDGPHITMRSPPITLRLISRNTWKSPYHLFKPTSSSATGVLSWLGFNRSAEFSAALMTTTSPLVALRESGFHRTGIARHGVAEDPVEDRRDRIAGRAGDRCRPFRIDAGDLDRTQKIENPDDENQRGILEQTDISVDDCLLYTYPSPRDGLLS